MHIERTASGYAIVKGGEVMLLKPAQMESLLSSLIAEMHNIPDRVRLLWQLSSKPRGRIVHKHKAIDGKITDVWQMEVFYPNAPNYKLFRGPEHVLPLEAIARGYESWGADVEVTDVVEDVVSYRLAEQEIEKHKWGNVTVQMFGMTLQEAAEYLAKHGKLPPERKAATNGTE